MFDQLLAHPGVEEVLTLRSSFGFMAFHGGSLEEVTDVIASAAAEQAGASYYGVLQPADLQWHIPSTKVDPAHSEALRQFLDHVDVVVTVHGYGREGYWATLLVGGQNRVLAGHLGAHLQRRLPAYEIATDLDRIPSELRGLHPQNPVNLPPSGGVQLELPPRVRGTSPLWWDWEGPGVTPHTTSPDRRPGRGGPHLARLARVSPSGREALDHPTALRTAGVPEPVVQPARAALPELHDVVHHPVPTPVWRARHVGAGEAILHGGHLGVQLGAVGQRRALRRRPRPDLAGPRPRREVGVGLAGVDLLDRAAHAHLAVQLQPAEGQARVRLGGELAALGRAEVGEEA